MFESQGQSLPEKYMRWVQNITAAALDKGFGELMLCYSARGDLVSGTLFLQDRRCSYYLLSCTSYEREEPGANTALIMDNIAKAYAKGLRYVDFVGVNSPGRGDFKISFNAEAVPYYLVHAPKH